jgi:hypothetical protein
MAFGRKTKTPIAEAEAELAALVTRRNLLERKLTDAAGALAIATDDRRQALMDSDLDDATAAVRRDAAVRTAMDQHDSFRDALSALGTKIAAADARLIAVRDDAARERIARAIEGDVAALAEAREVFVVAAARMLSAMQRVASKTPVMPDFAPRLTAIVSGIPAAIDELLGVARQHVAGVMSGSSLPARPAPQPAPPPPAPKAERQTIYCLSPLRWVEDGRTVLAPQYAWASPPARLATLALERGLAGLPGSEHVKRVIQAHGVASGPGPGEPERAIDLDAIDAPAAEPATSALPPGIVEERIGTPRTITIDAGRVA